MNNDRYEVRSKIGQGGVGSVYKAYDTQLSREVAIKRVDVDPKTDMKKSTESLLKEATALSAVQHPHIVTIYDSGIDEDGPYVVMELIQGKTLEEMIERGTLTQQDFKEVAIQTLEALIAAQEFNIIHRDLKPSNVMVNWLPSGRFQVKIVDFGLAKFSTTPSLQTIDHGGAVFGSIYFMAPEQFERKPLDKSTDMYALGCIYYYILSGKQPFSGDSAPQVMASHLSGNVKPLSEVREGLPKWLTDWVMWHISRNMEDRPQNAKESMEALISSEKKGDIQPDIAKLPEIKNNVTIKQNPVKPQVKKENNNNFKIGQKQKNVGLIIAISIITIISILITIGFATGKITI